MKILKIEKNNKEKYHRVYFLHIFEFYYIEFNDIVIIDENSKWFKKTPIFYSANPEMEDDKYDMVDVWPLFALQFETTYKKYIHTQRKDKLKRLVEDVD